MKIELKAHLITTGREGYGYETTLYVNGTKAGKLIDFADGSGQVDFHPEDRTYGGESYDLFNSFKKAVEDLNEVKTYDMSDTPSFFPDEDDKDDFSVPLTYIEWLEPLIALADMKAEAKKKKVLIVKEGAEYFILKHKVAYTAKDRGAFVRAIKKAHPDAMLVNGCKIQATI